MPIYYDVSVIQAIELNDTIRKSAFTFELVNNKLRIFPIPNQEGQLFNIFRLMIEMPQQGRILLDKI